MSSDIPFARALLRVALQTMPPGTERDMVEHALRLMTRRSPKRRAPNQSQPVDARLRRVLRRVAEEHPTMPLAEIGANFGVNQGRVSEALEEGP